MMTREEAIKILNDEEIASLVGKFHGGKEALDLTISALRPVSREQVERIRGEWMFPIFADQEDPNDPRWQCSECGSIEKPLARHRFCPACGSPMTDEAVQMVVERLEALKDGTV